MKKFSSIALVFAFVAFTLVSCKKDYTCTCTVHEDFTNTTSTVSGTIENSSKSDAEDECNSGDSIVEELGITITTECELD